ncbi:hypothetical protein UT300018_03230 [Clostridium faecium]
MYIPLGGNKAGKLKQFKNLFIVWFLTGLWHGANWNFILWGLYFGFFVTIEKLFLLKWLKKGPKFIGHIYTLIIVIVGWVFFEFESLSSAMGFIGTMFGFGKHLLMNNNTLYYLSTNIVLLLVLVICSTPIPRKIIVSIRERLKMVGAIIIPPIYLILIILSTAYLVNETYNPFLYFRF